MQEFIDTTTLFFSSLNDDQLLVAVIVLPVLLLALPVILLLAFSVRQLKTKLAGNKTALHLRRQNFSERLMEKDKALLQKNQLIEKLYHSHGEQKELIGKLSTLLTQERKQSSEKLALLEDAKEDLSLQFQSLAHRIFDEKATVFSAQSKEKLQSTLTPFQEQLHSFKRRIDDIYHQESQERVSLKQEIIHLRELNHQVNREAVNLTRALKGDKIIQGNWGEMILEKILEQSGLRKGHEYVTQEGFRNHDNQLLKPDVVVHLPEGKDIIIDSKVSLIAWEKYVNSDERKKKQNYFRSHLAAIKDHVTRLGKKDYTDLKGTRTLDFILMFMPIEAAFISAFQKDEQLFSLAFANKIIIVSPTTLLATLRSIENIWRFENQHQNSQEIARRAGAIHDKLCGFVEDMEKLGKQIETVNSTYEGAMTKLTIGRGNLIAQANRFTKLGIKAKKELSRSIKEGADLKVDGE